MSEHDEQTAVIDWCKCQERQHPELALIFAVPNVGTGSAVRGAKMKAEGLKAGVPDLCMPVARGQYHGLFIEMKFGKNIPTDSQQWWLTQLTEQGYFVIVCWSADEAIAVIENYLAMDNPNELSY